MRKTIVALGLAAVSVPFFAGCDGISLSPGEYTVVRIASAAESKSGGPGCMNDPNKTTTFRGGSTIILYGVSTSGGDQFFLDTGSIVLTGAQQSDGSFLFTGKTTDINNQGGTTITGTTTANVTLNLSGDSVDGKNVTTTSSTCSGNCNGFTGDTCTTTTTFVGVAVQGADVPPAK